MMHKKQAIVVPILRLIGNIIACDEIETKIDINEGVLQNLNELILDKKKNTRKEVCWVLSNITAGSAHEK